MDHYIYDFGKVFTRIDKNFAYNIGNFRTFQEDAKILKQLLAYIAVTYQDQDLFGFFKLDPKKFAKTMYLNDRKLFSIHPDPYFKKHHPKATILIDQEQKKGRMSEHRTWSSYLENALYLLANYSFINDYRTKEGNKIIVSTERFNYLDDIKFKLVKTGKTKKIVYYYKPNEKFIKNLQSYFLNIDIQKFNVLKKPNLEEAYVSITNSVNNESVKGINAITYSVDALADILNVDSYAKFSQYKSKITEKFERLKNTIGEDIPGLDLTWINPSTSIGGHIATIGSETPTVKYKSVPIVSWNKLTKKEKDEIDRKTFKNIFDTQLTRSLIHAYLNMNKVKSSIFDDEETKKKGFYNWFFSEEDLDIKQIQFKHSYVEVYKNTLNLSNLEQDFTSVIKYLSKIQSEHNCIKYIDNKLLFVTKEKTVEFSHLYQLINHVLESKK